MNPCPFSGCQNVNKRRLLVYLLPNAAVANWVEWGIVGSIPGRDRPKSLKLIVVAFPLGAQDYGNSTTTGPPVSG